METQEPRLDTFCLKGTTGGRWRGLLSALCVGVGLAPTEAAVQVILHAESRLLEVMHNQRVILTYAFAPQQFKPYVRELITLDGVNLLRDAPVDHVHHHGLMYGIKVNDINFWEEAPHAGRQIPQADILREVKKDAAGRTVARFTQVLHWVGPDFARAPDTTPHAILVERRSLATRVDPRSERIWLQWEAEFTVGEGAAQVVLTGTTYHGLGIRFRAEFDGVAERRHSGDLPFPEDGQQGVLPGQWMSVAHVAAGRPYTLTLFQHPSNAGRLRFFSMQKPFAYLSATQGLDEAPLIYRTGDRWRLQHLVLVTPGRPANVELEREYEMFRRDADN